MAGLLYYSGMGSTGFDPYGIRHSGEGVKGKGYFGILPHSSGSYATELSSESDINGKNVEYPLIVPTLSKEEINHLLNDKEPTDEIYRKAEEYARQRLQQGLNPFASPTELRYPIPTGLLGQ